MPFNKNTSKIAITIPKLKLLKHVSRPFEGKYNEPYIVSLSIDANHLAGGVPKMNLNNLPFPMVDVGDEINMLGSGHLVYGPNNPGEYVGISILIMESNNDIRELGTQLSDILKSSFVSLGLAAILTANPGIAGALTVVKAAMEFIAAGMAKTGDEELFRIDGTYLRDIDPPYDIGKTDTGRNDYIELEVSSIPLESSGTNKMEFKTSKIIQRAVPSIQIHNLS